MGFYREIQVPINQANQRSKVPGEEEYTPTYHENEGVSPCKSRTAVDDR